MYLTLLITTRVGWQTDMAKWIGEARAAKNDKEGDVVAEPEPVVSNTCTTAWKPVALAKLSVVKANIFRRWLPQRSMQSLL